MGKFHPSRRSYATSISNTQTNLEQLGGNSKAGLGFNIGLQNSLNQHIKQRAPTLSGSNMIIPKQKGLVNSVYEINTSNQLNNVKTVKYGMTRSPADGVNKIEREFDQKYTDYWLAAQHLNRNIPIIRGILPTNCCLPLSFSEKQLQDVLNKKIVDNFNFNLGNDLGNESPGTFLSYFQQAVGYKLDDEKSYWYGNDPKKPGTFLIVDGSMAGSIENGIFVRYILDGETEQFAPASFVSNRSPVPQKVYVLTGGPNSPRPSNNNSDPVVLLMKIGSMAEVRNLLPSKSTDNAYFMAGYPHDANSMDPKGRQWWPPSGIFGQGLHADYYINQNLSFNISMTPGAWQKNSTQISAGWAQPVLSTTYPPPYSPPMDWNEAVEGGGGLAESRINSYLFKDGTNDGADQLKYIDVYSLYKKFIDDTFIGNSQGILKTAKTLVDNAAGDGSTYNELLDGMLPSVLAINEDGVPRLDIRLMLSKLLTFNTLLWDNFPANYGDSYHWGWNEIPVHNKNTLWKSTNIAKNIYNLLVYIPNWNPVLKANDPWNTNGSQANFWNNLSNQLEKYVDQLLKDDASIDYINFVFATDEPTTKPNYLQQVLKNRSAYEIVGFTSLGNSSFPDAGPPPSGFTFTTPTYRFTYYKDNPDDALILGDSFVWKNN